MLTLRPDKPCSPMLPSGPTSPWGANRHQFIFVLFFKLYFLPTYFTNVKRFLKKDQINDLMRNNWVISQFDRGVGNTWSLIWMRLILPSVRALRVILGVPLSLLTPDTNTVSCFFVLKHKRSDRSCASDSPPPPSPPAVPSCPEAPLAPKPRNVRSI